MKIIEMELTGFKGIPYLVLHPKKINILVGKNNTGKTSILEAISSTIEKDISELQRKYGVHLSNLININKKESKVLVKLENEKKYLFLRKPEPIELIPEFKKQVMDKAKIIARYARSKINESEWKKAEELFDKMLSNDIFLHKIEKDSIRIEFSVDKISYEFSYTKPILRELEPLIEYINKNIFRTNSDYLSHFLGGDSRLFNPIKSEKSEKTLTFIRNLMPKYLSFNTSKINEIDKYLKERKILENLERFDIDTLLFKTDKTEYEIPFSFMGDGFKALVGLIAQTNSETKIVLIEEPENHMHPAYIKELFQQIIDFSSERDIQFFITTHNSDILDIVSTDSLEPKHQDYLSGELNIIKLDCLKDGNIMVQEITKAEALEALEDLKLDLRGN